MKGNVICVIFECYAVVTLSQMLLCIKSWCSFLLQDISPSTDRHSNSCFHEHRSQYYISGWYTVSIMSPIFSLCVSVKWNCSVFFSRGAFDVSSFAFFTHNTKGDKRIKPAETSLIFIVVDVCGLEELILWKLAEA